jgi:tetratricopeptide (TPR) repeat protein/DNA-binding transcriptional ArsR family regulator
MSETFLSRFTPSLSKPETLETITVGRQKELKRIVELVADSVQTKSKHHVLLIGPRGIGKTHLISLINYYLKEKNDFSDRMVTVWLREEEWGVSSFLDLLIRILQNLVETGQTKLKSENVEALFDKDLKVAEQDAMQLLKKTIGGKTLVLLVENLNEIFKGLGESGQQKLRSFIQENPFISIIATTQSLFPAVASQKKPFYGFFRLYHLSGLTFAEAIQLLINIAKLKKDKELADYLETPEGRARVRAVHHLVGGNPRLYVIFSEFLDKQSIENLVIPFMKMLDDLTPYYQERMRWISPQQRQIVEIMCIAGKPLTVKEIARRAFTSHQTASGQLKQLRENGYVESKQFGRESLYELQEPLMRLTVEVKKNRGEPIRLLVDFLRLWYSPEEIESRIEMLGGEASIESDYLQRAKYELLNEADDPRITACKADFNSYIEKGDLVSALETADELIAIKSNFSNWFLKWSLSAKLGLAETTEIEQKLKNIKPKDAYDWYFKGQYFTHWNRFSHAINALNKSIQIKSDMAEAWSALTNILIQIGNYPKALEASSKSTEIASENISNWYSHAHILSRVSDFETAKSAYQKIIDLAPDSHEAWANMGWFLCESKKYEEALTFMEKAVKLNPNDSKVLTNLGWALAGLNKHEEAIKNFKHALEIDPNNFWAYNNLGWSLIELGDFKRAKSHFQEYTRLEPTNAAAWDGLGQSLLHLEEYEGARLAAEKAVTLDRKCFNAWSVHGITLSIAGKQGGALLSFDNALKYGDHSSITLFYRAVALLATGKDKEGLEELDHAICQACRVHGVNLRNVMHFFDLLYKQLEPRWNDLIPHIINSYIKYGLTNRLEAALVKFQFRLLQNEFDKKDIERWTNTWQKFAKDKKEMDFSIELLKVATKYKLIGDESILHELPEEERKLITAFEDSSQS